MIFAIKIPLVLKEIYQVFNLIPLPIQRANLTLHSYIDPYFPYLLLSASRAHCSQLEDLSRCKKIPPTEYVCEGTTVRLTKERSTCETDLRLYPNMLQLPANCQTRTLKSVMEIWHQVRSNQWLFVLTNPTAATLNCGL